jgi:SAM-dependent methyltransferase
MAIHPWAEAGFGRAAAEYERGRPGYPEAALAFLVERLALGPGRMVVDLAAGTGKLARLLVASGACVIAVEPVRAMRELIEPGAIEVLAGTAEAVPLPTASADAVTVAQGLHWFRMDEALAEIHRILRPGGALAVIRNVRDRADPVQRRLEEVLARHRGHPSLESGLDAATALVESGLFARPKAAAFPHAHELDAEDLVAQLLSETSIAVLDEDARAAAADDVRRLAATLPPRFPLRYRTEVHVAERLS